MPRGTQQIYNSYFQSNIVLDRLLDEWASQRQMDISVTETFFRDDASCRTEPLVTVSNDVTRLSVFSNTNLVGWTDAL